MELSEEIKFSSLMPDKLDITTAKADTFRHWLQQWKDYCQMASLDDQDIDLRLTSLKDFLTNSTLEFVDNLSISISEDSDPIDLIISALRIYICGQSNIVHQRRNFNLRHQDEGEMFDAFLSDLLELAKTCEFCVVCQDSLIRDRIIIGLRDGDIIDKLLEETDLTLQAAIDICRAEESAKLYPDECKRRLKDTDKDKKDGDGTNAIGLDEVDVKPEPDEDSHIAYSDEDNAIVATRKRKRAKVSPKKVSSKNKSSKGVRKSQRKKLKIKRESDFEDYDDLDEYLKGSNGDDDVEADGEEMEVEEEVPHPCDKCKYVGKSKAHLDRHDQNQHAEVKPYACAFCDRTFGMKVRLTRHVQGVHEKLKPFHCALCATSFSKKSTLKMHIRAVHDKLRPFACDHCDATFSQGGHLNRHKLIVHENVRRFKCDLCDKRCATQTDLNMHVKNNHKEIRCSVCDMTFDKKPDLRYHLLTEHQFVKPHLCESCGKSYTTQCALNGHMTREHGQPEVPCDCRSCTARANHSTCIILGESGEPELATISGGQIKEIRRPHLCDICGKSYTQLPGLKYHMQSVHGMSDKSCKCESCQAELNNEEQSVVDKHFKQPHKHRPHKCKLCTSSFTQINSLTEHIATVHSKVKRFGCDLCKSQFTSHKHLGVHIRSIHLGIKPFECPQCNAKFSQLGHRNRHVLVVHEGLKKFACDLCDKKYASKIDLKYHLKKIHGKVIFFECSLCDGKFDQRKHLMSHIAEVHQSQDTMARMMAEATVMTSMT